MLRKTADFAGPFLCYNAFVTHQRSKLFELAKLFLELPHRDATRVERTSLSSSLGFLSVFSFFSFSLSLFLSFSLLLFLSFSLSFFIFLSFSLSLFFLFLHLSFSLSFFFAFS